jgi:hypothetical protein
MIKRRTFQQFDDDDDDDDDDVFYITYNLFV